MDNPLTQVSSLPSGYCAEGVPLSDAWDGVGVIESTLQFAYRVVLVKVVKSWRVAVFREVAGSLGTKPLRAIRLERVHGRKNAEILASKLLADAGNGLFDE